MSLFYPNDECNFNPKREKDTCIANMQLKAYEDQRMCYEVMKTVC